MCISFASTDSENILPSNGIEIFTVLVSDTGSVFKVKHCLAITASVELQSATTLRQQAHALIWLEAEC